jgi:NMD protein affecting ribosome stability and mRNA decay
METRFTGAGGLTVRERCVSCGETGGAQADGLCPACQHGMAIIREMFAEAARCQDCGHSSDRAGWEHV